MANGLVGVVFVPFSNVRRITELVNAGDMEGAQRVLDLIIETCSASKVPDDATSQVSIHGDPSLQPGRWRVSRSNPAK